MIEKYRGLPFATRLALVIALIVTFFSGVNVALSITRHETTTQERVQNFAAGIAESVLSSLNAMMIQGTIGDRQVFTDIIRKSSRGLEEIRIVRGDSVNQQYGEGSPDEAPKDDLDR
ncbi:MAG: hypothetical protein HQK87_08540, partial [Nitrospinae bacterium]|nr:hypothetical protein [Nitrospinota bacterium]